MSSRWSLASWVGGLIQDMPSSISESCRAIRSPAIAFAEAELVQFLFEKNPALMRTEKSKNKVV